MECLIIDKKACVQTAAFSHNLSFISHSSRIISQLSRAESQLSRAESQLSRAESRLSRAEFYILLKINYCKTSKK
jgi:hypothetical protein